MAEMSHGTVKLGRSTVELKSFTGRVGKISRSSETHTTVDHDRRTVSRQTYNYVEYEYADDEGETWNISAEERHAGAREGAVMTGFITVVPNKDNRTLAYYNHDDGSLRLVKDTRNIVAGPAGTGHAYLIILAVIFGMIGIVDLVDDSPGVWPVHLAICGGIVFWVYWRRKQLLALLDKGVAEVKAKVPGIRRQPEAA